MAIEATGGTVEYKKQAWRYFSVKPGVKMSKQSEYVNEYGVKSYNQGFYKFGPMEQCTTGEWVKWKDVEPFLRAAELRVQTAMETEQKLSGEIRLLLNRAGAWEEYFYRERGTNHQQLKRLDNWRALAIGLIFGAVTWAVVALIRQVL